MHIISLIIASLRDDKRHTVIFDGLIFDGLIFDGLGANWDLADIRSSRDTT